MTNNLPSARITIREFQPKDRKDVRRISCETAFLELNHGQIFDNPNILSDALTLYFTDFEPQSCIVAEDNGKVIGYLIGAVSARLMNQIMNQRITPRIIGKLIADLTFFRKGNANLLLQSLKSLVKGEFFMPDYSKKYPATLHINIDPHYRGQQVGSKLIMRYLDYLRAQHIPGVYLATYSENAKEFFQKMGFQNLFKGKRTYLKHYAGRDTFVYILGRAV